MSNSILGGKEIEGKEIEDDIEEDELNDTPFADVQQPFRDLVRNAKVQLYTCIIKGPPITSKEAQDNTLLLDYLAGLNRLYQLCDGVNTHTLTAAKKEKILTTFPLQTHQPIKDLLDWLTDFFNKNQYVDTIPYSDYLEVQLRRYPFLQK